MIQKQDKENHLVKDFFLGFQYFVAKSLSITYFICQQPSQVTETHTTFSFEEEVKEN